MQNLKSILSVLLNQLAICYGVVFFVLLFVINGCAKKQEKATAFITVLTHQGFAAPDANVNFYVASNTIKKGALDTTIKSDQYGHAEFKKFQECFLNVLAVKTIDSVTTGAGTVSIHMIPGETVSKTIYLR
jgi:hypothetical protein